MFCMKGSERGIEFYWYIVSKRELQENTFEVVAVYYA